MNFEIINSISQFDEILKNKKEIRLKKEIVDGIEIGIIHYMIEEENTFNSDLSRECRGISFRMDTGEIVSRPFHKFWNINQKESTQESKIDFEHISYIDDKSDGSLAIPVLINNKVFWKTKKSFYSPVAKKIQKCAEKDLRLTLSAHDWLEKGYTPLYEYIAPDNRIVVEYEKEELRLLNIRNNITGEYLFPENKISIFQFKNIRDFILYTTSLEKREGFVIYDGNDFYKIKSKWYMDRHKALSQISVRTLINMFCDDTLDDVIAQLNTYKYYDKAKWVQDLSNEFSKYVLDSLEEAQSKLEELTKKYKRTELRCRISTEPLSSIIYPLLDKIDPIEILKKRMKSHMVEKYKNAVFFMGEIN